MTVLSAASHFDARIFVTVSDTSVPQTGIDPTLDDCLLGAVSSEDTTFPNTTCSLPTAKTGRVGFESGTLVTDTAALLATVTEVVAALLAVTILGEAVVVTRTGLLPSV